MKKTKCLVLILILLSSVLLSTITVNAFEAHVSNFDRIWYHPVSGFNKNGIGTLILAATYTNATAQNPNFREIDYCSIEFHQNPFYFGIEFQEEIEIIRDDEGNIIYQEPKDGYVYLRKSVVDNYLPNSIRKLGSTMNYSTITFQEVDWYRIYVPNFNRLYEWKKFVEPETSKKWYTWGNNASVQFETKAMYVQQTKDFVGHLEYDFTHPTSNSGQKVAISKSYLSFRGITTPVFEWGSKIPWQQISYTVNDTHYFITPKHFSFVGIHEASTGSVPGFVVGYNNTDYPSGGVQLEYSGSNTDSDTIPTYPSYDYQTMDINWTWITKVSVRLGFSGIRTVEVGIKDNSGVTLTSKQRTIDGAGTHWDLFDFSDINTSGKNTVYRLYASKVAGTGVGWCYVDNLWPYGEASFDDTKDYCFKLYGINHYNITRTVGSLSEINNVTFTSGYNFNSTGNVTLLKIPVSISVRAIIRVYNFTTGFNATEVVSLVAIDEQFEYYYDPAGYWVYLGVANISSSDTLVWQVNATYGGTFLISFPTFKVVGDDIVLQGTVRNGDNNTIGGVIARTYIYFQDGSIAVNPVGWNCTNGNFHTVISTTSIPPGIYSISVEFTDFLSGVTFKKGEILYLSFNTPSGVYSDALVYFYFYNTNEGLGLPRDTLKIYVNGLRTIGNIHFGYLGQSINLTIKDYYNLTMYYEYFTINHSFTFVDAGLTFHSWLFGNNNPDFYMISLLKDGATRWWERGIIREKEFLIPSGNYTMRIYDKNDNEIHNNSYSVLNSKIFVIYGTNLSEILDGQSVIVGKLLEVKKETQDIEDYLAHVFMPDVTSICRNIPYVYSTYQGRGTIVAGYELVCPYQAMTATTKNETAGNNFISYPLVPTNGTTENGTIRIISDRIYFAGSVTWLNVSYDGNYTNTSYIPSFIDPFGADVTINASSSISVTRETDFQQIKKFDWRAYEHTNSYEATVDFENPLNTVLKNVVCTIEFANDDMEEKEIEPDYPSVSVYDVTNGVFMTSGSNFNVEAGGITFLIPAIDIEETRSFTCFHDTKTPVGISGDAIEEVNDYDIKDFDGKPHYYIYAQWTNPKNSLFIGSLHIQMWNVIQSQSFKPREIAYPSVVVYDRENVRYLFDNEFTFQGSSLMISQEVMGSVAPNHARSFDVYFLSVTEKIEDSSLPTKAILHKTVLPLPFIQMDLQVFHIIILIGAFGIGYPLKDYFDKKTEKKRKNLYVSVLALAFLLVIVIAYLQGL